MSRLLIWWGFREKGPGGGCGGDSIGSSLSLACMSVYWRGSGPGGCCPSAEMGAAPRGCWWIRPSGCLGAIRTDLARVSPIKHWLSKQDHRRGLSRNLYHDRPRRGGRDVRFILFDKQFRRNATAHKIFRGKTICVIL